MIERLFLSTSATDDRTDALEELVHQRNPGGDDVIRNADTTQQGPKDTSAYSVLRLLAEQLPKLISQADSSEHSPGNLRDQINRRCRKRLRTPDGEDGSRPREIFGTPSLPSQKIIDESVSLYFSHIHPWIPMIHQRRFRDRLGDPSLDLLLHAMIFAASKFIEQGDITGAGLYDGPWTSERTRAWVVSIAMGSLSVEHLQALTIIAFTDVSPCSIT